MLVHTNYGVNLVRMAYFKSQGLVPGSIFVRLLAIVLDAFSASFVDKGSDTCDCDSPIGLLSAIGEEELV